MTLDESLEYFRNTLDMYWQQTQHKELGNLLGGFSPYIFKGSKTADPAASYDWTNAVRKVTRNDSITKTEANEALILLLKEYNDHHGFKLVDVIEHFVKMRTPNA